MIYPDDWEHYSKYTWVHHGVIVYPLALSQAIAAIYGRTIPFINNSNALAGG